MLGPVVSSWNATDVEQSPAAVWLDGVQVHQAPDSATLTGRILQNIQHTASYLRAFNRIISSGEVLILGAVAPPPSLRDRCSARISVGGLPPLGIEMQK